MSYGNLASKAVPLQVNNMSHETYLPARLISVVEAAKYLGCGEANVYGLIRSGVLPYVRVGCRKGYRIDREDIDRFIAERKEQKRNIAAAVSTKLPRLDLKHILRRP